MNAVIFIVATTLTAVFAASLAVGLRNGRDAFSPWCLVPGLHLLRTSPFLFLASTDPEAYVHPAIVESLPDLDSAFLWYGFVELCGFAACMLGISGGAGPAIAARLPVLRYRISPQMLELAAMGALMIGFVAYLQVLRHVGGLSELLGSLDMRVQVLEGTGVYISLMTLAAVGCVVLAYTLRFRYSHTRLALVCFLSLSTAAMFSTTGGRKLALGLVVSLLMVWHWGVRPIRHPVRLGVVVVLAIAPYFVAMPLIRSNRNALAIYMERPADLVSDVVDNSSDFIRQLSYCETYLFVTNYFTLDSIWMGQTYLDLLKAPVPRQLMPQKPALDEGMYIYTLAQGGQVYPGMPSRDQNAAGWPTETLGTMYWNFHLPGVVAGMFVLGSLLRAAFEYLMVSRKSLFSIFLYQYAMFGLALSNIRIVQFSVGVVAVTLLFVFGLGARMQR
ncbi:MAG: hypothetical protein U0836_12320 [Pirellulales bacterium]